MFRRLILFLVFCFVFTGAQADNIMFRGYKNALRLDFFHDVFDNYSNSISMFTASYSQPNTFFRLDGRRSIHASYMFGKIRASGASSEWRRQLYDVPLRRDVSQFAVGLTQDAVVYKTTNWYFGGGVGPYVKEHKDDWLASNFMFGIRVFAGYNLGKLGLEFILHHFSNGHLTELNRGQNTAGLGVSYNF